MISFGPHLKPRDRPCGYYCCVLMTGKLRSQVTAKSLGQQGWSWDLKPRSYTPGSQSRTSYYSTQSCLSQRPPPNSYQLCPHICELSCESPAPSNMKRPQCPTQQSRNSWPPLKIPLSSHILPPHHPAGIWDKNTGTLGGGVLVPAHSPYYASITSSTLCLRTSRAKGRLSVYIY